MLTHREDAPPATHADAEAEEAARILAAEQRAAEAAERARQLQEAVLTNREIGYAIGLLMAHYHLDDQAAYEKLRSHSRDLNLKMRDLAAQMIEHHNEGCRAERDQPDQP